MDRARPDCEYIGKHYRLRFMNTWPRPIQQPHPEVWIPGAGSLETMEFVARRRYAYMGIPYFHISVFDRQFRMFREACEREGYTYEPRQAGWLEPIYVAETDEQARAEYEPHFWYWARKLLPGHRDQPARLHVAAVDGEHPQGPPPVRPVARDLGRGGRGRVRHRRLAGHRATRSWWRTSSGSGTGNLLGLFQLGTLPADLTRRNLELFASEVMPRLKERFPEGQPILRPLTQAQV